MPPRSGYRFAKTRELLNNCTEPPRLSTAWGLSALVCRSVTLGRDTQNVVGIISRRRDWPMHRAVPSLRLHRLRNVPQGFTVCSPCLHLVGSEGDVGKLCPVT